MTLVVRAREGDSRAFEHLVRRHQQTMYRVALRIMAHADDAEDAVQNSFVSAWRRLGSFRLEAAFSTWMYRIVTNQCLNSLRSQRERVGLHEGLRAGLTAAGGPESEVMASAQASALAAAVRRLSPDLRVAWVLRESEGLGYTQIAEIAGTTPDAVRGRIHRARTHLAQEMNLWR